MDERLYEHLSGKPHPNVSKRNAKKAAKKRRASTTSTKLTSKKSADDTHDETETDNDGDPEEEVKYCWVCQTEVHVHSMHCKYCDKCVSNFDHHCMWLNTCIGSENYATFFKSVWCLTLLTSVHLVALILFFIGYFHKVWNVRENSEFLHAGVPEIVLGFNLAVGVFIFAIVAMVVQLLMFHRGLKREGITTYQFIMQDSQDTRDKALFRSRVKERRHLELTRNRLEGRGFVQKTRIQMGGMKFCGPCDPVRKMILLEKRMADGSSSASASRSGKDENADEYFRETPSETPSEADEKKRQSETSKTVFEKV